MDDNNQQWYPETDAEQKDLVDRQKRDVVASLPVVQEVLDWFDRQISTYKNPLVIDGVNPSTPAEDVKCAVLLAQAQIKDFKAKRGEFETKFRKYITEAADAA